MSKQLFNNFSEVSAKQWKQKIQADLKGVDYNQTLIWQTNEGITVKPFYHNDDFNEPFLEVSSPNNWLICQQIYVLHAGKSNKNAHQAIAQGAESLQFIISDNQTDFDALLQDIPNNIKLYFQFLNPQPEVIHNVIKKTSKNNIIYNDILGNLTKTGNWYHNTKTDHKIFSDIANSTKSFSVNLKTYQNAGANITQQLAYTIAHANEYLNYLNQENKLTITQIVYQVAVGSNYFFEIAKLKALRLLHDALLETYHVNAKCHIIATPSKRNKTIYDYNTNMLRTTTECMSAILGGANTICNLAYDAIYHKNNAFGERIAKNQLLVLKNESYFNTVSNPTDGAYYIESLTKQLAENALKLFKDIEKNGGFYQQLLAGTIQRKIIESANTEQKQFNDKKITLLGTNKYPNPNDKMKSELEIYPFLKTKPRKTFIQPILQKRLAESLEQERLNTEN